MDLKKKLGKKNVLLIKIDSSEYRKTILETMKSLSKGKVCYVTLNKTYNALEETFEENKINLDNVFFIDVISGSIKDVKQNKKKVYFISSPSSLTELSLAISKTLEKGFDYLIFDSINNLLTYHSLNESERFLSSIINKIKDSGTKAIFSALQIKEQEELINKTSTFVDETVDISSEKKSSEKKVG